MTEPVRRRRSRLEKLLSGQNWTPRSVYEETDRFKVASGQRRHGSTLRSMTHIRLKLTSSSSIGGRIREFADFNKHRRLPDVEDPPGF